MELYDRSISHEQYLIRKLGPARRRQGKFEDLRVVFHNYPVPGTGKFAPEYLVYLKGQQHKIGFDPGLIRKADLDDPDRILQFLLEAITGKLPSFSWYYLRSFAELVRVEQGQAAPPKAEQERVFEADRRKLANDYLKAEYDQGLAFSEDIEKTSKKHDELFRSKIMGEKDRLELLGPEGTSLKTAEDLARKLEE